MELQVLTFNTWGLLYISKDLDARMNALANELAKGYYDIVALQEVWSSKYFQQIADKVKHVLPFSHYFYSGAIGSGCATFSRYPIVDTFFTRYSHGGYFWDITCGDWYAGKGVGCVIIQHPSQKKIFVYNTHLHANYGDVPYTEIRTLQICQLIQTLKHSTRKGDHIIVCGDFNHESEEIGIQAFLQLSQLKDSYHISDKKPSPCYTLDKLFNKYSKGEMCSARIDYIFVSNSFQCTRCDLTMQKVKGTNIHYSDHEAYCTTLKFLDDDVHTDDSDDSPRSHELLHALYKILHEGKHLNNDLSYIMFGRKILILTLMLCFVFLPVVSVERFQLVFPSVNFFFGKLVFVLQMFLATVCAVHIWVQAITHKIDRSAFQCMMEDIKIQIATIERDRCGKIKIPEA